MPKQWKRKSIQTKKFINEVQRPYYSKDARPYNLVALIKDAEKRSVKFLIEKKAYATVRENPR